jgi:hypothetical protein
VVALRKWLLRIIGGTTPPGSAMSKLGHLDCIDAFEFSRYLCLVGRGTRPTLGWTSWFASIDVMPNTYQFLQEAPNGATIQAVIPLQVIGVFTSTGVKEVTVRHSVNGKPTDLRIAVRPTSSMDERAISGLMSPSVLSYLHAKGADRTLPPDGAAFSMRLGAVDVPFACATWSDPPRPGRYDVHLDVDALLPGPTDLEAAVQDCFRQPAVADALARLLTPAGWTDGVAVFRSALEDSLLERLGDRLVNVRLTVTCRCIDDERAAYPTSVHHPALRSVP